MTDNTDQRDAQTRKEALEALLMKVEAGGEDTPDFSALVLRPIMQCKAGEAYRGSLDAALALHETVLPGNAWGVAYSIKEGCYGAWSSEDIPDPITAPDTPARAWLIAILKALIAQEADCSKVTGYKGHPND